MTNNDNSSTESDDISTKQAIEPASQPKKKGPSAAEIRANVVLAIDRSVLAQTVFPLEFPEKFHRQMLKGSTKYRLLVENEAQVLSLTDDEHIASVYSKWADCLPVKLSAYNGTPGQVDKWVVEWRRKTTPFTKDIATVLQATTRGYCWHRLDFDMSPTETPIFDALCSRIIVNREAFLAWCGALFDPHTVLQQYAWLYGEGQNGKGSLFRFLRQLLGAAFGTLETDERRSNQFTMARYVGKRLLVDSDCSHPNFVTSSTFKQLTGGDAINVEFKGKDSYTEILPVMCAFGSNMRPKISSEKADLRRALFVEFAPLSEGDYVENFESRLWDERAGILHKMWQAWLAVRVPGRKSVPVDEEAHRILASETEVESVDLLDRWFVFGSMFAMSRSSVVGLYRKLRHDRGDGGKQFYEFLSKQEGVVRVPRAQATVPGRPPEHLKGVTLTPEGWAMLDSDKTTHKWDIDRRELRF